jgi:hypothetical protein
MKIEIEITGDPFLLHNFYKAIRSYIKQKACAEGIKIRMERK